LNNTPAPTIDKDTDISMAHGQQGGPHHYLGATAKSLWSSIADGRPS
jgi:hypothetical protein